MELTKLNMRLTCRKGQVMTQITVDDDFNVPDAKEDIERILKYQGDIQPDIVKAAEGKVNIHGKLVFRMIYGGGENSVHSMKGSLPFEDTVNVEQLSSEDDIRLLWEMEDLNVSLINSRKISVKAVISLTIEIENTRGEEIASELYGDNDSQYMTKRLNCTPIVIQHKDTYRIKDEIEVSGNKPNISDVLWDSAQLRSFEARPTDGSIHIRGEIFLFVLYRAEDENASIQWSEHTIPFNGKIEVNGCHENMVPNIMSRLLENEVEVKPDYDGEQRMFGIDYIIDMDIRLYEDQQLDIISDVYSSIKDLEPVTKELQFERLLMRNSSKCKTSDKLKLPAGQPGILQICNSSGTVKLDDVRIVDNGIQAEGAVYISLLYAALDDKHPLQSLDGVLPFSHIIEIEGIYPGCEYNLKHSLEQLSAVMQNSEEIELKAVINLDAVIMENIRDTVITDVTEKPYDLKKIKELPGIVGYVVKPGDTLWKIAKKFYTTVDSIKSVNERNDDTIHPGERLVLVKKVEEL